MPTATELIKMNTSIVVQAKSSLSPTGELLPAIIGKTGIVSVISDAIRLMTRSADDFRKLQKDSTLQTQGAAREVAVAKVGDGRGMPQQDYSRALKASETESVRKWEGQLRDRVLTTNAPSAAAIIERFRAAMPALEMVVDRMRLVALEPTSLQGGQTLEELLARTHLEADLEQLDIASIENLVWAEQKLNPAKFDALLPVVVAIARKRASQEWTQNQARKRDPQRVNHWTTESSKARGFLAKLEAILASRVPKDLEVWDETLAPQVAALVRAAIGVDVRELSQADLATYTRNWRPGGKLSEVTIDPRWPLKLTVQRVDPRVRAPLSAGALR